MKVTHQNDMQEKFRASLKNWLKNCSAQNVMLHHLRETKCWPLPLIRSPVIARVIVSGRSCFFRQRFMAPLDMQIGMELLAID